MIWFNTTREGEKLLRTRRAIPLVHPMLAVSSKPFDSDDYIFEIKWDGYRCLAYLDGGTEMRSRNLLEMTGTFPELGRMHQLVGRLPVLLDGEIVIFENGMPSFSALQARGRMTDPVRVRQAMKKLKALYIAFDVLYVDGRPVINEPLEHRKEMLKEIIKEEEMIQVPGYLRGEGILFAGACAKQGLEGIMAKKVGSLYLPGKRSANWKKIRHTREADLVICGYRRGRGGRRLGALVLGGYCQGKLIYVGKVGAGFSVRTESELLAKLSELETGSPIFSVPASNVRDIQWVMPELVCAVEYLSLTRGGLLRHPSFKGLRYDKAAEECLLPETIN